MPVSLAGGTQDYGGLLVPEVWSPRVVEKFYEYSVLEHISNSEYEGEITQKGSKVNIRLRPDITIRDYLDGQDLTFEEPNQPMTELVIDQAKYWAFKVRDLMRAQSDIDFMREWTDGAGQNLNESVNASVLAQVPALAHANNSGATAGAQTGYFNLGATGAPVAITKDNVISYIGACSAVLSEQAVPESDRWLVIPPWMKQLIFESPSSNALIQGGDQSLLRKKYVGNLATFDIFESNQLPMVTDDMGTGGDATDDQLSTSVIFGHKSALTFAAQLTESEVIRAESQFGWRVRGLQVYGYNVIKPEAMGHLYCYRG